MTTKAEDFHKKPQSSRRNHEPVESYSKSPKATPNDRAELRSQLWKIKKLAELEDYELMAEIEAALARHAQREVERALKQEEDAHSNTINQRDNAEEWADKLAYAIAPIEVIGEHSNINNPWANALTALQEKGES